MNYQGIQGFDVSTWQDAPTIPGHVDFERMKAWGADFVIIRAGQGNWEDPDFQTSWANAKGILPRASYFYYDNRYPPKDQARKYYETIKYDLEGVCWLNLEDRQQGIYAGWRNWYDFLAEFEYLYPSAQIGIYTGFFYWMDYITYATNAQRDYFGKYPLWLANYGATGSDPLHPHYTDILIPLPWLDYLILQTGTPPIGEDVGVESKDVDYDQFNGGVDVFKQYFKMSGETELPQEGTDTMESFRFEAISAYRMSLRPAQNVNNTPITTIPAQTKMNGNWLFGERGSGECWLEVKAINNMTLTVSGWVAVEHDGRVYCALTDNQPPAAEVYLPDYIVAHFPNGLERRYLPE